MIKPLTADEMAAAQHLNYLYALAVDTQQWDLFDEIFTEDVVADYPEGMPGLAEVRWTDLKTWKEVFAPYHAKMDVTQHTITNVIGTLIDDAMHTVSYGHWRQIEWRGGGMRWEGSGWYNDLIVPTDAGWRIKERTARRVWSTTHLSGEGTVSLRQAARAGELGLLKNSG